MRTRAQTREDTIQELKMIIGWMTFGLILTQAGLVASWMYFFYQAIR